MEIIRATPLYEFLRQCNAAPLEKNILDCGAGGANPTLSLFFKYGYKTRGIEIAETALAEAQTYCAENKMPLNIIRGDMRHIPFPDGAFSFVYSYNAIFFMTKPDIAASIREMRRVLKPNGLCFVNFKSVDDPDKRPFCETAFARRLLKSERFAQFEDTEADDYFAGFDIVRKEKRILQTIHDGKILIRARIDYIVRKS